MLMTLSSASLADEFTGCHSYVGQQVSFSSTQDVLASLRKTPTMKGEFETTADFESRKAAAFKDIPKLLVLPSIFEGKHISYDADQQAMSVKSYALSNLNTDYAGVFGYGTDFDGKIEFSRLYDNLDAVIYRSEKNVGQYSGENAYGASRNVRKIDRRTVSIFEREGEYGEDLFPSKMTDEDGVDSIIGFVYDIPIEQAKLARDNWKSGYVVELKSPYFTEGPVRHKGPSITRPTEINETLSVVIADIKCGIVTDSSSRVLLSEATR